MNMDCPTSSSNGFSPDDCLSRCLSFRKPYEISNDIYAWRPFQKKMLPDWTREPETWPVSTCLPTLSLFKNSISTPAMYAASIEMISSSWELLLVSMTMVVDQFSTISFSQLPPILYHWRYKHRNKKSEGGILTNCFSCDGMQPLKWRQ